MAECGPKTTCHDKLTCPSKSKTPGEMARKATSLSAAGVAPAPTHSYADADEMIEGACPDAFHLHIIYTPNANARAKRPGEQNRSAT